MVCTDQFAKDKEFLQMLNVILEHTIRDLVFYSIGIIINMSLHGECRPALLEQAPIVDKLIGVLSDANLEDIGGI